MCPRVAVSHRQIRSGTRPLPGGIVVRFLQCAYLADRDRHADGVVCRAAGGDLVSSRVDLLVRFSAHAGADRGHRVVAGFWVQARHAGWLGIAQLRVGGARVVDDAGPAGGPTVDGGDVDLECVFFLLFPLYRRGGDDDVVSRAFAAVRAGALFCLGSVFIGRGRSGDVDRLCGALRAAADLSGVVGSIRDRAHRFHIELLFAQAPAGY